MLGDERVKHEENEQQEAMGPSPKDGRFGIPQELCGNLSVGMTAKISKCKEHHGYLLRSPDFTGAEFLDEDIDPHAESMKSVVSSVPDDRPSSQYPGQLKIVTLGDKFNNPHLIIGTRLGNYLVTAAADEKVHVGPKRCGNFVVTDHFRLLISKIRQEPSLLDDGPLGLAQVRSHFAHKTTYTTRRGTRVSCSELKKMPLSVFTLFPWKVPGSTSCLKDLSELFVDEHLNVTKSAKAEEILRVIANENTLSDSQLYWK
ncbi:hypothetical protein BGX26_003388 [Mortierella sp. AD094]|nr:hypothetical protein BGX26_003388 [Mortierella sp. AD094]